MRHSYFRVVPRVAVSAVAALVLALTLAACGGGDDATTTAADTESAAEAGGASNLTGVVWEWQGSSYSDDSSATPDDPSRYTIEFLDDGTASIKADCNQVQAQYTADGTSISITPGASTKVARPEDTLDFEFLPRPRGRRDVRGRRELAADRHQIRQRLDAVRARALKAACGQRRSCTNSVRAFGSTTTSRARCSTPASSSA